MIDLIPVMVLFRFHVLVVHQISCKGLTLCYVSAFLLITSIMLLKYNKKQKYEEVEVKYNKLRMHKLTWLLLIFTLMFEHYQLASWFVDFQIVWELIPVKLTSRYKLIMQQLNPNKLLFNIFILCTPTISCPVENYYYSNFELC